MWYPPSITDSNNSSSSPVDGVTTTTSSGSSGMDRTRKSRISYTPKQICYLEKKFGENEFPSLKERESMAKELSLSTYRVQVWFQNRRAKARRKKKRVEVPHILKPPPFWPRHLPFDTNITGSVSKDSQSAADSSLLGSASSSATTAPSTNSVESTSPASSLATQGTGSTADTLDKPSTSSKKSKSSERKRSSRHSSKAEQSTSHSATTFSQLPASSNDNTAVVEGSTLAAMVAEASKQGGSDAATCSDVTVEQNTGAVTSSKQNYNLPLDLCDDSDILKSLLLSDFSSPILAEAPSSLLAPGEELDLGEFMSSEASLQESNPPTNAALESVNTKVSVVTSSMMMAPQQSGVHDSTASDTSRPKLPPVSTLFPSVTLPLQPSGVSWYHGQIISDGYVPVWPSEQT